jgi:glucose-6-phosphate 1-dehydrogenase
MRHPGNMIIVIFGASGDLTSRKLIPALFSLKIQNLLPERFAVLGTGRTKLSDDDFRVKMNESIHSYSKEKNLDQQQIDDFMRCLYFLPMESALTTDYDKLTSTLNKLNSDYHTGGDYIFYMATPPKLYPVISGNLSMAGLTSQSNGARRFIVEKPFGYDHKTAKELNIKLHEIMDENQIYRIDHYLGKETVQNVLVTRFANGIFEPLWNRNYVHRIEITAAESIGVERRGGYYDSAGALRDMLQNHMLQMVGLIAMEPPTSLEPDAIRNEVLKVFQSFQPVREADVPKQVIRGQYTASKVRGEPIPGYRSEKGVPADSKTETFVAMRFFIDNWRWGGVPFYVRTGKWLPTSVTEIVIHFKRTPHRLFQRVAGALTSNQLIIRIQPDEGMLLKFDVKEPGSGFNLKNVNMEFHYRQLGDIRVPSAYERLLYDVMTGDSTLFLRDDEVETAWKFLEPVQNVWANNREIKTFGYPAGTWGPEISNILFEGCGYTWRYPCKNLADEGEYCEL